MVRENLYFRPILVNVGVVVALSFAGFFYSRLQTKKTKRYLPPPKLLHASDCFVEIDSRGDDRSKHILPTSEPEEMAMQRTSLDNGSFDLSPRHKHGGDFLLQEFSDNVPPCLELDTSRTFIRSAENDDYEQEIKYLRDVVRMLSERERNLEIQLFEYYGLKEQETAVLELQNQLNTYKMEAKLFGHKIESLQAKNQRLEAQVADHARVIAELETARSNVKEFKKKLRHETEQHRQQILNIQKRVARLQEQELAAPAANSNQDSERLKFLEVKAEELRKSNLRLQMENSQLSQKLQSTQIQPDSEIEALNEMSKTLRQENQDLTKQNEQLKAEKITDLEELVYLRWINDCLRQELKNYQPLSDKTVARDLSKSPSPRPEEKAKKLVHEYAKAEEKAKKLVHEYAKAEEKAKKLVHEYAKAEEKAKKLVHEYAKAEGSSIVDKEGMDSDSDQLSQSASQTPINTDESSYENTSSSASKPANKVKFFKKLRRLLRRKVTSNQQEDADSSATSLNIPRQRSLNMEHVKYKETLRRNSDFGSYGYKSLLSTGKDDDPESPVETRKSYQDLIISD